MNFIDWFFNPKWLRGSEREQSQRWAIKPIKLNEVEYRFLPFKTCLRWSRGSHIRMWSQTLFKLSDCLWNSWSKDRFGGFSKTAHPIVLILIPVDCPCLKKWESIMRSNLVNWLRPEVSWFNCGFVYNWDNKWKSVWSIDWLTFFLDQFGYFESTATKIKSIRRAVVELSLNLSCNSWAQNQLIRFHGMTFVLDLKLVVDLQPTPPSAHHFFVFSSISDQKSTQFPIQANRFVGKRNLRGTELDDASEPTEAAGCFWSNKRRLRWN